MAHLVLHNIDTAIVDKLKQRAEKHCRELEDELTAILRDALLTTDGQEGEVTFETYLQTMPDVGADADFSRIEGSIRDASLAD
jgi:plasmid stability protein